MHTKSPRKAHRKHTKAHFLRSHRAPWAFHIHKHYFHITQAIWGKYSRLFSHTCSSHKHIRTQKCPAHAAYVSTYWAFVCSAIIGGRLPNNLRSFVACTSTLVSRLTKRDHMLWSHRHHVIQNDHAVRTPKGSFGLTSPGKQVGTRFGHKKHTKAHPSAALQTGYRAHRPWASKFFHFS